MKNKREQKPPSQLFESFKSLGQEHVFDFWKELASEEREKFLDQLYSIDLLECKNAWSDFSQTSHRLTNPTPPRAIDGTDPNSPEIKGYRKIGNEVLAAGKVASFTVAGGQGTRLGHDGPKGSYPCSPISNATLFRLFAENLSYHQAKFGIAPYWFVMTSPSNHDQTLAYFEGCEFFGLPRDRIKIFSQGMMPAFDRNGKFLLDRKNRLALSPNGHGGAFRALMDSGALDLMEKKGIDHLSYFQVDNPLVYCLDPVFIGLHVSSVSDMSSKAVCKACPKEKVGIFALDNQALRVIEYSDAPPELLHANNADGGTLFNLGNIAIHMISRSFIAEITNSKKTSGDSMPYHCALKKVANLDSFGNLAYPDKPNAIKAEKFIFDALPLARNPQILEVAREEEFAPIKNAKGDDSRKSSIQLQAKRSARWLRAAGLQDPGRTVEISPAFAPTLQDFIEETNKLPDRKILESAELITRGEGGAPLIHSFDEQN